MADPDIAGFAGGGFAWLNPPPAHRIADGALDVTTGDRTDFWQGTWYGFHRDDAHAYLAQRTGAFAAELTFSANYVALYDQAGLLVRAGPRQWMKCGVEFTDGAPKFSVVVTNGVSDWSTVPLTMAEAGSVSIRVSRMRDALFIQFRTGARDWAMARLAPFPEEAATLGVGPFCCSPQRAGFTARFTAFAVSSNVADDIH